MAESVNKFRLIVAREIIIIIFFSSLFSQNESILILDIDVEGNQRLSQQDILRNARLFKGMTIKGPEIQQAIKRLWKLKRFGNIQILVDDETNDGLYLLIVVEEYPILAEIEFEGNKKKSKRSLKEELDLHTGQILSENAVFEAMEKIRSLYAEKHYHNVTIDTVYTSGVTDFSENLKFVISIGKKTRIKNISFSGNNIFSDRKLLRQFKENKAKKWYLPWGGAWKEDLFDNDKDLLAQFYKNKGYRDFYIVDESVQLTENGKGYNILLDIYEGPQYKIRDISWAGNYVHSDEDLLHRLNYNTGDIFTEDKFNMAISERVSPLYTDKGYYYFQINPTYTPIYNDSLDIHFEIVENQIVHIRKININGNQKTHENVIRRELRVYPGDIFSRQKIMDSYRDIFMLNFFENVIPDIIPVSDEKIDVQLDVIEKNTGQANLSMGYNGMYGFTGGGGFEFPNFRGKGQTLSISYQRGMNSGSPSGYSTNNSYYPSQGTATNQSFSISFTEPWLFDTPNLVGMSYFYKTHNRGQGYAFDTQQHGGYLRWGRRFKWPDYFFRGSWMIRAATNKYITPDDLSLSSYFKLEEGAIKQEGDYYTFSSSGISFIQTITRDSRNHPEFPTSGSKSIWISTLSGGFLGGNQNYHKHVLDFNYFTHLHNKFTVSQILKVGILKKISSRADSHSIIPPSARFIMGGDGIPYGEMLRGYNQNKIGPINPYDGSSIGGNIMLKYSFEFRLSLSANPTIYVLSFFEMGNIWSNINDLDPFDLKRSAGAGVRVFIPMLGMLGYDIGYGFDYSDFDKLINNGSTEPHGWEHHIIFGMPF